MSLKRQIINSFFAYNSGFNDGLKQQFGYMIPISSLKNSLSKKKDYLLYFPRLMSPIP